MDKLVTTARAMTLAACAAVFVIWPAPRASAQVLVSSLTSSQDDFWGTDFFNDGNYAKFSLNTGATIDSASLFLLSNDVPASDFTATFLNDSSGAPGGTSFGSFTGTGTIPGTYTPITFNVGTPINLGAGTYWLRLTTTNLSGAQWGSTFSPTNTGTNGSVLAPLYYNDTDSANQAFMFSLSGTAVPEASPLLTGGVLTVFGVAATLFRARRRRRLDG